MAFESQQPRAHVSSFSVNHRTITHVCTGSASLKFNYDLPNTADWLDNYWSDSALFEATGKDEHAYLDFYCVHFVRVARVCVMCARMIRGGGSRRGAVTMLGIFW